MQSTTQVHREALQRQTQQDWANREYIELISGSIKRIADFLNSFDMSCRYKIKASTTTNGQIFTRLKFMLVQVSTVNSQ
jgi:uncharacterized protein